jgi:hypothetical protein
MTVTACVVSASGQNAFIGELLDALADALVGHGVAVERAEDHFPPLRDELVYVVVPHEYLPLTRETAHPTSAQLRRTVAISTEQPGTRWFDLAASLAERAGAVLDINALGVEALRQRGVTARHLQLGYVPAWDRWAGADAARPVDVMFLGAYTPRRGRALARCGTRLRDRRAMLRLTENRLPHTADDERFLAGDAKWRALAETKLLLNVHREQLAYLEWQRFAEAIANGCVVVSEHSLGFAPLVPGEHFVSVSLERLPHALDALLDDEERVARIRADAYDLLREQLPLARTIRPLTEAVDELGGRRIASNAARGTHAVPAPRQLTLPPTEPERLLTARSELDALRMGLKQVLLEQRELRRVVVALHEDQAGTPTRDTVTLHGAVRAPPPRVSVVLTVYNYAAHVAEAIESVAASEYRDVELIVVEDKSSDDSLAQIEATLRRCPWLRAKLIARARNGGLPAGRNLGLAYATGDLVFVLDADNAIYPHALGRLVAAMDADPECAFAYGIIEQFSEAGSTDLVSFLPWDPRRLRYGNYVDAMAMVRREALLLAGGYTTDPRLYGWEDFALWCTFAHIGLRGVGVPEILTRYRTSAHSMIAVTNIDVSAAWSALVGRFPFLAGAGAAYIDSIEHAALQAAQR